MLTALSSVKSSSSVCAGGGAGKRAADDDDDDYGGGQARFVSCVRPRLCFTPSLTLGPLRKRRQRLEKGLDGPGNEWPLFSVHLQVFNTRFLLPNNARRER